jgi:hypothetical protein
MRGLGFVGPSEIRSISPSFFCTEARSAGLRLPV